MTTNRERWAAQIMERMRRVWQDSAPEMTFKEFIRCRVHR